MKKGVSDFVIFNFTRKVFKGVTGNQLNIHLFSAHLDCLMLYLKARSLGILPKNRGNDRIDHHGEIVSYMAHWNIDWRYKLCNVVAKAFFFHIKWTFGM